MTSHQRDLDAQRNSGTCGAIVLSAVLGLVIMSVLAVIGAMFH